MASTPTAGIARADLVTLQGSRLTAFGIVAGRLTDLGSTELSSIDSDGPPLSGDWADRDHLFVSIPPRTVLQITAAAVEPVALPDPSKLKTPRPKVDSDDALMEGGEEVGGLTGLVISDGAAWWSACPWGYPYDGWQCEEWVNAQLWPKPSIDVDANPVEPRDWAWPDAKPRGLEIASSEESVALVCTSGGQKKQLFRSNTSEDEYIADYHWVSAAPPRLLIVYGTPGLDSLTPTRWTLHDGCAAQPLARGTRVAAGPSGMWAAWETDEPGGNGAEVRLVIRRDADILGELPAGATVLFRPSESK